jgi:UDP-GlcNAc:undecaprenyl-phosphate/decaprenyl-phosphate GlcNAc-1-phosphate transferase
MDPVLKDWLFAGLALAVAWATAFLFTPRLREAAIRFGIVDRPDGKLKTHREPVAYLGGLAVALGVLVALGMTYRFDRDLLAVLLSASIVLVLGLLDDLGSLGPRVKLAGQVLAALVLIKAGVRIELVFLPDWIELPLTVLWMVAVTNAFNLIDIMDGLSSGVGTVAALFLGGIALANGFPSTAFLGAALAGGLWGFRHYNVEPAKIYLGDTGSLYTGFILGAMAIVNRYTTVHTIGLVAPVLILGVPLFDTAFVMYIRWRRGLPVMLGSPDHVALRLRKWRLTARGTVRLSIGVAVFLGVVAVGVMLSPPRAALAALAGIVVLGLAVTAWLRKIDMSL